ncbi:MAG: bifunctional adenosylcobinamide kinase/adenosylcobinamide-phosphate guanylyltransferase [Firmicutes bacterium]|nr:bifunctional adenosylcobinamide kinase/adenosylcobinamide-phosphate guanylyltransferase [Bacillota bacterium]MBQ3199265.1 bifunctional adenosylcobinamide kinase/adenosylcobinamide-phosphate guanylyltransferase [Bacillota bacterium]
MILIVGGEAAGKRTLAAKLGYSAGQMSSDLAAETPVIFGVEQLVADYDRTAVDALARVLAQKQVVICNEVGCGIIPMQEEGRRFRKSVGRLCALLAEEADCVVRVVCGLPQVIKGELPKQI